MKKFLEIPKDKNAALIGKNLKISEKIANIFIHRNIATEENIKKFLNFGENDIPELSLMKDADKALERITKAIFLNERVVIYADYDADGTCAASVMIRALRTLGLPVEFYTNDRLKQGFGMKVEGVKEILAKYPDVGLVITVDNGIVAFDAAEYLKSKNIDLIITDHHEPDATGKLPVAYAVVDPKRKDCTYPFKELCGTGIAYRLMKELCLQEDCWKNCENMLIPLVAIGTVADCVSMTDENRYYVKKGLKELGNPDVPALTVLNNIFNVNTYDEDTIGYYYAPMINSSSRMIGNAAEAIKFFTTDDYDEALAIGLQLQRINEVRKQATATACEKIDDVITQNHQESDNVIVMYDASIPEGIVGIVAGRITEKYGKPSIVFTDASEEGIIKGSARSVEGFNIKEAFDNLSDMIIAYGGHAMAAGISINGDDLDAFRSKLNQNAQGKIPAQNKEVEVELVLDSPEEIDINLLTEFKNILRPFGTDWPVVKVCVKNFKADATTVKYLKDVHLKVQNGDYSLLMFNNGVEFFENLTQNNPLPVKLDAIGDIDINVFKGNVSYQVIVKDNCLRAHN